METEIAYMAQELALSEDPGHHFVAEPEKVEAGLRVMDDLEKALALCKLDAQRDDEERDATCILFQYRGFLLRVYFTHHHGRFFVTLRGEFSRTEKEKIEVDVLYDRSSDSFVGRERNTEVAVMPGQYPPRESALRVITRAVQEIVQGQKPEN